MDPGSTSGCPGAFSILTVSSPPNHRSTSFCINIYFSLMATKPVLMRIISHRPNNKCQVDLRVVVASVFFGLPLVQPAGYKLSHA